MKTLRCPKAVVLASALSGAPTTAADPPARPRTGDRQADPASTSTQQDPVVVFTSPDLKPVTLRLCNSLGCSTVTKQILVLQAAGTDPDSSRRGRTGSAPRGVGQRSHPAHLFLASPSRRLPLGPSPGANRELDRSIRHRSHLARRSSSNLHASTTLVRDHGQRRIALQAP